MGKVYVARHFPPEAKEHMLELVNNLIKAYEISITELDWMSDATKAEALDKLSKFTPKIGYPDKWKDYSALDIEADDLVGNMQRSALFDIRNQDRPPGWTGRPDRVGHDTTDGERLLQPAVERNRVSGRHPAATLFRSVRG